VTDQAVPADHPRKVLFVAGAGRSGTSTMAGLMQILGLHVPQPEVVADESNPKGFGEPQWLVTNHERLLREAGVQVSDARPDAWVETGRVSALEHEQQLAATWLDRHFSVSPELVVKDPRLSWFLPLWQATAVRTGATPVYATMLRPPAEVVGSRQAYYQSRLGAAHLAASWLNMLLHTERATRGTAADGGRVFVRYADLLDDWATVVMRAGEQLGLQHVRDAGAEAIEAGNRFVDPDLRRMTQTLDDLALPRRLHELTAQTWAELNRLAEPGGDTPEVHETLDQLRDGYTELYAESEAISRSSVVAAEQRARKQVKADSAPAPARSLADRIPHRLRALVPARLRRGLRRLVGRSR
jgi:hypothetical protein